MYIVYFVAFLPLGEKVLICFIDISYYCTYPELFNINYLLKHSISLLTFTKKWHKHLVLTWIISFPFWFLSDCWQRLLSIAFRKNCLCFGKTLCISLLINVFLLKNEFLVITFHSYCDLPFCTKALTTVLSQTHSNILTCRNALKEKKQTNVTPILRKVKKDPRNYRPASLTLISGKMMKQLILETISRHMKDKKNPKESSAIGFSLALNFKNRARNLNLFRRVNRRKIPNFQQGRWEKLDL